MPSDHDTTHTSAAHPRLTPFQGYRLWQRRAPLRERAAAAIAVMTALALLGWVAAPDRDAGGALANGSGTAAAVVPAAPGGAAAPAARTGSTTTLPGGPQVAAVASGDSGMAVTTNSRQGAPAGASGTGGSTTAGSSGCLSPPGSDQGVTKTSVNIAIALSNIVGPAGNETVGIPSADEQQTDYQIVIDALNAAGGVACRKLVPTFYRVNPADPSDLQKTCIEIVASKPFAELDPSNYADFPQRTCFAQEHIPFFTSYFLAAADTQQFYPYMFAFDTLESLYRNTVFALRDKGFFSPSRGFRKLGFAYRSCVAGLADKTVGWLHETGLSSSQIVTYDLGCPTAFANPADVQQAVLKFQQNGVTHVTLGSMEGDIPAFTSTAQQQGFHPKYGLADEAVISTSYGTQHPDYNNIAGAIAITAGSFGEERTPGLTPSAGTKKCDALHRARGRPPIYQQKGGFAGYICNEVWMFAAAVNRAPALSRAALAAGLQTAHSVEFSWPQGPNDFSGDRVTYAGQYWRTATFTNACNCWRVLDAKFRPSYP